jgi:phosphatidylserine/phosphatidylglycerophosphate/cardiolipin synthase-like enzyme
MIKKVVTALLILAAALPGKAQAESIADAKAKGAGTEITVSGVVINGDELGVIRYIQDASGGLAIYDPDKMGDTELGDSITLTGTLVDYNNLLEIQPVASIVVEKNNAQLPVPLILTPAQLGEAYEGMLVSIESAVFDEAGSTFASKTNYDFSSAGEAGVIRISDDASPFIGTVIPSGETDITGILSQFYDTYQILVRTATDITSASSINFLSAPVLSMLSTTGFTLSWETEIEGTTEMFYGNTPDLELGKQVAAGTGTSHEISVTGADASQLFYVFPFSVSGDDTAKVNTQIYITQSNSSGDMKAYFNRPVDNTVSSGTDAVQLDHLIDDTLINYINRAQESIDFTIYNFNNTGISNIADALNAAHDRGVMVRVVYDINQANFGTDELNSEIGKMASPVSEYPIYGIMHNKFVVFDALSDNPDLPIVWTGATNFTDGQINTDPNNVVVIQDKSLAIAYRLEFNEMFGSEGAQPNAGASRFGPDKLDNTPHEFIIGGHRVESYFSPSDNTHSKILATLKSADTDLSIATMLITKTDLAYAIRDGFEAGVKTEVLVKDEASCDETVVSVLKNSLQDKFRVSGEAGIMHHKYAIVDQSDADSDPIVLTGSHNWSNSAQYRNDENTLIIHQQDLANQYYQEFVNRFKAGLLLVDAPVCEPEFVTMTGGSSYRYDVLYNDDIPGAVVLEINQQPTHGSATVESDQTITYVPESGFNQDLDTVFYKVCMESNLNICDSSMMVIYVNLPVGVEGNKEKQGVSLYPNPTRGEVNILLEGINAVSLSLYDLTGKKVFEEGNVMDSTEPYVLHMENYENGYYYVVVKESDGIHRVLPVILQN